ncbi:unnamed protein product [Echinostoma caproni]|uniref:GlnE domain-containing protein n=1 Tax=Echinostoma caproni TaxID=27848 RepID=A0A183B3I4_9TREM|nr:unnamed protein product [Echinostoma caproni]
MSNTVALHSLLNRALPTLDDASRSQLLPDRFVESLPGGLREMAWIINDEKTMDVLQLANVLKEFTWKKLAPKAIDDGLLELWQLSRN